MNPRQRSILRQIVLQAMETATIREWKEELHGIYEAITAEDHQW